HPSPYSNLTTLPTGISSPRTSFFLALSLHHALPIGEQVRDHAEIHALDVGHAQAFEVHPVVLARLRRRQRRARHPELRAAQCLRSEEHTSELQSRENLVCRLLLEKKRLEERKRQRLN